MKNNHIVTIIKRSCLTGRVVWIYKGKTQNAGRTAYLKACKKEIKNIRNIAERMLARRHFLLQLASIGNCNSRSYAYDDMTPEQRAAVNEISRIANQPPPNDNDFYEHIIEEVKQRNWKSERWKEHRIKMIGVDELI